MSKNLIKYFMRNIRVDYEWKRINIIDYYFFVDFSM